MIRMVGVLAAGALLVAGGCASSGAGAQMTPEQSDAVGDAMAAFVDGVVEGCVDAMESSKGIEALHSANGAFVREQNAAARQAAGVSAETTVWRPARSAAVTVMEDADSCTVGVIGLPPGMMLSLTGEVLVQARKFTAGEKKGSAGAPSITHRYSKQVGERELSVLLVGLNGSAPNLLATIGWKEK